MQRKTKHKTSLHKTPYYSYSQNNLAKGCKLCVQGLKSVFFVTGICPEHCFYCPISDQKKDKDVIYINEHPTREWKSIKQEIILCNSKGAGFTGGDPLARLSRTITYIKKLKNQFGKSFHIHLYTPLTLVNSSSLKKLSNAGLDEIRFHPSIESPNKKSWEKILHAKKISKTWKVGVEIPVIPKKEKITKQLIDYISDKVDFLNLNELEYSDTNAMHMDGKNLKTSGGISYAINGSEKMAFKLLKYIKSNYSKMNVHFCTAKLKDKVQLRKRITRRAHSIKHKFDTISNDGTLIHGAIYLNELLPGKDYKNKLLGLSKLKKQSILSQLKELKSVLKTEFKISNLSLDKNKLRLLTSVKTAKSLSKKITSNLFKIAVVEEYPTYDEFIVEIDFL